MKMQCLGPFACSIKFFFFTTNLAAQSVVELPQTSLSGSSTPPLQLSEQCLGAEDAAACQGVVVSERIFSIEDVVNLGIIDREEAVETSVGQDWLVERQEPEVLPSVDLEVFFDYDSSTIRTDQIATLVQLQTDLSRVNFENSWLVVVGHTDAVGSETYNRDLSLRRAQSVAEFYSDQFSIPRSRIRTSGAAFDYLRVPDDPTHAANRRVQILLVQ